jgi:hypothetical protein
MARLRIARILLWSGLLVLLLPGCMPEREPVVVPAVFRWHNITRYDHAHEGYRNMQEHGIQRMYHKLLDIGWNPANGAHPISFVPVPSAWRTPRETGYLHPRSLAMTVEFVPCIYITNETFLKLDDAGTDELAFNLLRKLRKECPVIIHGVMLDCDWTEKTRARFFRLAQHLNDSLDVPLTSTIRLHQYANPKGTGVPPVDRGMLMPYNVGQVSRPGPENSIFDRATAEPYFRKTGAYPLPLDIALPAFTWGALFRKDVFQGILHESQLNEAIALGLLKGHPLGTMQVVKEDNRRMPELHLGDVVRVERMTPDLIDEVVQLATKAVNSDTLSVAFFEIGSNTFRQLDTAFVRGTFARFGTLHPLP